MLRLPASQRPDRPRRSVHGGHVLGVGAVAVGWLVGTILLRIRRLQRTAARHAGTLDHAAVVGAPDGAVDEAPVRLLVLGDSAARGFGLTEPVEALPGQVARRVAAATGHRVAVTCEATDGHRTADVLAVQLPQVAPTRPDVVVVGVGVNDALGRTPDRALATATADLVGTVRRAAPDAGIVVVACPDLSAAPGFPWPLGAVVGWRCRRVARVQADALAAWVRTDARVRLVQLPRPNATLFGVDGFHPGAAAHAAMADLAAPHVAELLSLDLDRPTDQEPAWTSS